ncbi:MAG TPA: hypothetical protein DCL44_03020 [Elusimicrobia bacterium]|nr:hypothetical protein [Elusimicrobiota bacterium]
MKNKAGIIAIIVFLTFVSLALNVVNVKIGLPSPEQINLVFGGRETVAGLSTVMKQLRDKVYTDYQKQTELELMKMYMPSEKQVTVRLNNKNIRVEEQKIHSMRSALLQTRWPDEQKTLVSISQLGHGNFNPHVFHYGGFYLYSCGAALKICEKLGIIKLTPDIEYYFLNTGDAQKLYAIPKILGGIFGALSVPLIFFIGLKFFNLYTGLFSAAFMAVVPSLSAEAHSFKPFAFFIPFALASLYFSFKMAEDKTGFGKNSFFSGVFAGLSMGAMFLSGILILSPILAHIFHKSEKKCGFVSFDLFWVFFGFSLAFLATNPFYLTSFGEVFRELVHLSSVQPFEPALYKMVHYSVSALHQILGYPLYITTVIGTGFFIARGGKREWLILIIFLPFYFYTSNVHWDVPHYSMLLVPLSVLISGNVITHIGDAVKWRLPYKVLALFAVLFTFANSSYYQLVLAANQKNLIEAGKWISSSIPKNSSINMSGYPYFGFASCPPFDILNYSINKAAGSGYYIMNDINYMRHGVPPRIKDLSLRDPAINDAEFPKNHKLLKEFRRDKNFLDAFYKNYLYIMLEQEFKVYSKTLCRPLGHEKAVTKGGSSSGYAAQGIKAG